MARVVCIVPGFAQKRKLPRLAHLGQDCLCLPVLCGQRGQRSSRKEIPQIPPQIPRGMKKGIPKRIEYREGRWSCWDSVVTS